MSILCVCEIISWSLICQKGDILPWSLTWTASEPKSIFPAPPIRSIGDILTGSITFTEDEPARMLPLVYDIARLHLTVSIDYSIFWDRNPLHNEN